MRVPSPRAWWRARCAQRDNRRLLDRIRRAGPAPQDGSPRVSYARAAMPGPGDKVAGGFVKCLDLHRAFPHHPDRFTHLYLVSSALPPEPLRWIDTARAIGARVVLNQNGVAYPAWHGPGWEKTNVPIQDARAAADFIVYQSKFSAVTSEMFLGPSRAPCAFLHNPVDTSVYVPSHKRDSGPWRVLCAGTHLSFYRIKQTLETLQLLLDDGIDAQLVLAGRYLWASSEEKAQQEISDCIANISSRCPVEIHGSYSQNDGIRLMQSAHVLVHPKVNDVCPRLVVEALSCGVPVVYSATGGTPELVPTSAGIGVPSPTTWEKDVPPSPNLIAGAVKTIFDSHFEYSTAARGHAVTNLDVQPWLERHRALFSQGELHA